MEQSNFECYGEEFAGRTGLGGLDTGEGLSRSNTKGDS